MLSKGIRVLDLDGSLTRQKKLLSSHNADIVRLSDIGPDARFWMNGRTRNDIVSRLVESPKDRLTFLGSGDFHHVSSILIDRFEEPLSVIDFDLHPDMSLFSVRLNCGSWVAHMLRRDNVRKCVIMGASSRNISTFLIEAMALGHLKDGRVEIYPYSHPPSFVLFQNIPENISIETKRYPFVSKICWNELKRKNLEEFFLHVIRRLPTKKVYLSIDKDCLVKKSAVTNWEEGSLGLEDLLVMLKIIKENLDIIGADVCGDYSSIRTRGVVKSVISSLNHPPAGDIEKMPQEEIDRINERTNLRIAELLS